MTLVSRFSRSIALVCILLSVAAVPAGAQTSRKRAVSPANATGPTTRVLITAKDASNGVAIASATLTYAGQTQITDANGQAPINLPIGKSALISIDHPAFLPFVQSITAQVGGTYDVTLTEKASVTIKTTNNETHVVDIGTAQFANSAVFSSPERSDTGNFCKEDGTDFLAPKTAFAKIIGPGVLVSAPQCCQSGKVISANVVTKSGQSFLVYFKDSCSGNEVDFVGREKSTGKYQYYRFTDIAEIDFP